MPPLRFRIRRKLTALVTRARLARWRAIESAHRRQSALHLGNFERRVFSQNGEDGIIGEIFRRVGPGSRYFVEFGIEDGTQSNCRHLLENQSWRGLWIEGSPELAERARLQFGGRGVRVASEFITRENIGAILKAEGVPHEPDFLSIDIDGNDYWVWQAIASEFSPRVVAIEYNAAHTPGHDWVMPYDPAYRWDRSNRFGASLDALARLGRGLGYVLVGCERTGVNAFFVREDLASDRFVRPGDARFHYASPKYHGIHFGHPPHV